MLARAQASPGVPAPAAMLLALRGVGPEAAARLWSEGLFRTFTNRKQVAAYAGLAPTPWQSGSVHREQGVSKAGNPRLRTIMIQLAWLWLRHQPQSALAVWFHERIKRKGGRFGKTMIVGGNSRYPGAPFLAASSALRSGAGLVTLAVGRSLFGSLAAALHEATFFPLAEEEWGTIGGAAAADLSEETTRLQGLIDARQKARLGS